MIEIKVKDGSLEKFMCTGKLTSVLTDLTTIIGYTYGFIKQNDSGAGDEFKRVFMEAWTSKGFGDAVFSLGELQTKLVQMKLDKQGDSGVSMSMRIDDKDEFMKQLRAIVEGADDDED